MNILPYGDNALLINFDQKIDLSTLRMVQSYSDVIKSFAAVNYQIPAYCSITIVFDGSKTSFDELKVKIENIVISSEEEKSGSLIEIPVCYEQDYAPDLDFLSEELNKSKSEIIELHTSKIYDVYMMGFLPGFPYLGKLPEELKCSRRASPRKKVSTGSVGIAGIQTGIYPCEAPGGWQLIGKTPLPIFKPKEEESFLITMDSKVKFKSISSEEFKSIANEVQ